jgi:DNA-binding transcriptional regulator/RsmH inhibitor MraZ
MKRIEPKMTTSLIHGSALCDVDTDGNVAIPAFLAEALDGDSELLVSKHGTDGCLVGYDRDYLKELSLRTEARRIAGEARGEDARKHHARLRRTFGVVEKMPRAGATIRIPAAMRHLGRIGGLALFVGTGDGFEIWNPDLAIENEDEQFRDLAAFQLKARGGSSDALGVH